MGGGGILLRGVAKAVSRPPAVGLGCAASIAAGSSGASAATSSSAAAARCLPNPSGNMMIHAAPASSSLRLGIADDWEFAGGEEEHTVRDHFVFGAAPTRDEVEEATSDLQHVLGMYAGDLGTQETVPSAQETSASPISSHRNSEVSSVHFEHPVLDWIEPHLVSHIPGTVQVRRRNEVAEAFRLLQNDPVVQGVVMSIASDKAVWEAVLKNDKVKEFRKKLESQGDLSASEEQQGNTERSDPSSGGSFLLQLLNFSKDAKFVQLLNFSKDACLRIKSMLEDLINSLLTFADKKFMAEKDGDAVDRALKSCFMLGLIVMSIVMVKRAAV